MSPNHTVAGDRFLPGCKTAVLFVPFFKPSVLCVRIRADAPLWKVLTGPGRCGGGAGTPCMTESFLLLD